MKLPAYWDRNDFWLGLARGAGGACILIGAMVLFGWWQDVPVLKSLSPDWVAMKANTALGLVLSGLGLWLRAGNPTGDGRFRPNAGRGAALGVLLIGAVSLFEYLSGSDLGIDQLLFFEPPGAIGTLAPGRMAPASALGFVLIGMALLVEGKTVAGRRMVSVFAISAALLAMAASLIFLYGTVNSYGLSIFLQMAAHTAFAFLLLSVGLLCTQPESGLVALIRSRDSGGALARRLLPISLLLPVLIGWLKLYGDRHGLYEPDFGVAVVALSYVVMLVTLVVWSARFMAGIEAEREWMHASVAVSEARLRTLVATIPDMIWLKDIDGVYLACNSAFERFFGAKEADIIGKTDYDFIPREQADFFRAGDRAAIAVGGPGSNEEWIVSDAGRRILTETIRTPMFGREGELLGVLGIARDITRRHEAEEAIHEAQAETKRLLAEANQSRKELRDSNALLSAFIRHSPIYAFVKEVRPGESRVLMASENYRDMVGIPGSEMAGKTMGELFPPEFAEKISADDWGVVSGGEVLQLDEELRGRSYITVKFPIPLSGKNYLAGYTIDITERKQAEKRLRELNSELEQRVRERTAKLEAVNKELEAFSYSVSHDLRAPLRAIAGFIALLKKRNYEAIDDQGRHYMDVIADAAVQMRRLIDDILTFSRIGSNEMSMSRVDMGALLGEVRNILQPEVNGRKVEWRIGSLPDAFGERGMLSLVLQNLLSNALKFTRTRDAAVIEIGSAVGGPNETVYYIRDNGVGFDMRHADKLFGLFQRMHPQEQFEGTGVGLANVQRIVQRHGGRVWAESVVDEGATFYFALPRTGDGDEYAGTDTVDRGQA